jgi:pimeloyl-ACP methyl ester carboxylesterase
MQVVRSADGTAIAVERSGDGPPLVLVGGAFQDRSSMTAVAAGLRDAFTVYEYDRRGRGGSDDTPPYAIEREVEDLAALIEAAGGPAFVFGQSSGGALALEAAARGVPVRALVVNEPPYAEGPTVEFAVRLEKLVEQGRPGEATVAFLALVGTPPTVIAQMKAAPGWPLRRAFARTLSHEIRLCNNGELPADRLAAVSAPTLVLAGETSAAWARDTARAVADTVSIGRTQVLAGQGHVIDDDVLISVLREFFLSQRASADRAVCERMHP